MKKLLKRWGYEIWVVNNELYGGKILFVEKGKWSSNGKFHKHMEKDETFYVISGELHLEIIENGKIVQYLLNEHSSHHVPPRVYHRFTTNHPNGCTFIEFSTPYGDNSDCYYYTDTNKETK